MLVDTKMDHSCRKCDWSWNLNPTAKEVKAADQVGVSVDPICVCLNPAASQKMPDGLYPRLAQIVRDEKTLCGPKGLWWKPIKFIPPQYDSERPKRPLGERPNKKPQHIVRRQSYDEASQEQSQQVQSKPRKPYKVG